MNTSQDAGQPHGEPDQTGSEGLREDMVQKLVQGFHDNQGAASVGDFLGVEFHKEDNRPTEEERDEAYRRYVDELADEGLPESTDGEQ